VHCNNSTDFFVEIFSLTTTNVDPDIAVKRVGEFNPHQFSWHWPGEDESILRIVTSIVDKTILSMVNAAISGLPDPSWKIQDLWGCREESNGDGGPHTRNV
jgi:hypothetical protein